MALFSQAHPGRIWFEWIGLAVAFAGLIYLVLPGISAPPPIGSALMITAGISWGMFTLLGRGAANPTAAISSSMLRSLPCVVVVSLGMVRHFHVTWPGAGYAIASGALTSGCGYAIWYAALRGLTATRAAILQLSVPILAAVGGVLLLGESISMRTTWSAVAILGGVGISLVERKTARAEAAC